MSEARTELIRYLRAHHISALVLGLFLLAVVNVLLGPQLLPLPSASADAGSSDVPLRRELPIVAAALVVGGLSSPLHAFEMTAGTALRRAMRGQLAAGTGLALVLGAGTELAFATPESAAILCRSLLAWTGLALLSGRILGWGLAWLAPVVSVFPLVYYGNLQWWDWTTAPVGSPAAIGTAVASLTLGLISFEATQWRLYHVRRLIRRTTTNGPSRSLS